MRPWEHVRQSFRFSSFLTLSLDFQGVGLSKLIHYHDKKDYINNGIDRDGSTGC